MDSAVFRFFGNLNDLLRPSRRHVRTIYPMPGPSSVKHPIEALGVPHTEVEAILVNDVAVDLGYQLQPGDRVEVFPPGLSPPGTARLLRTPPEAPARFVADIHLGRLVSYLRRLGFDVLYRNDFDDEQLAAISAREGRVLLTRDRGLLKRSVVIHGCLIRSTNPRQQVSELLARYPLTPFAQPWSRCIRCNGTLVAVEKAAVLDRLEPLTRRFHDHFMRCGKCGQVYWEGSHVQRSERFITEVLGEAL